MRDFIKRAQNGDEYAQLCLVKMNLPLVIHIAREYQNLGLPLNDIISEGNLGLIEASQKVEDRGFSFQSFAFWHIKSGIKQAIMKYGNQIHYSNEMLADSYKIKKYISKFQLQFGYEPSEQEISENLNMPINKVHDALTIRSGISIDGIQEYIDDIDLFDNFINSAITDLPEDDYYCSYLHHIDSDFTNESCFIDIDDTLNQLTEREKEIITMFFGIGCKEMDLNEIAIKMNLSRERTRQIKENAIKKLRKDEQGLLRAYLG